jgi:hypothetical protein
MDWWSSRAMVAMSLLQYAVALNSSLHTAQYSVAKGK